MFGERFCFSSQQSNIRIEFKINGKSSLTQMILVLELVTVEIQIFEIHKVKIQQSKAKAMNYCTSGHFLSQNLKYLLDLQIIVL